MIDIQLQTISAHQVTCVPNIFIDEYMLEANGEFIKIYLYLLRLLGQNDAHFSISSIADELQFTEGDVRRALTYWEKKNLLRLSCDANGNITSICFLEPETQRKENAPSVSYRAITSEAPSTPQKSDDGELPQKKNYSAEEIKAFKSEENVKELLMVSERYMGHTLSMTDINTILFWYDGLQFSTDLVEYVVEYCVENGHSSIHYMNKVALNWASLGIASKEEAKNMTNVHSQSYFAVMKAFGISGRNLIDTEVAYIEKWTGKYNFTLDIINEACHRTIRNIGRANFEYADKILTNWHENGIRHLEDIAPLDEQFGMNKPKTKQKTKTPNRFQNFDSRNEDDDYYEKLEQKLLRK